MEKEFVPYELAVKLKALGFDEPCFGYYHTLGSQQLILSLRDLREDNNNSIEYFSAPTFSQAFRWFRKNHNLHVNKFGNENYTSFNLLEPKMVLLAYCDYNKTKNHYEEAELACLDKLIKLTFKSE